jgi:hypothetical protein
MRYAFSIGTRCRIVANYVGVLIPRDPAMAAMFLASLIEGLRR